MVLFTDQKWSWKRFGPTNPPQNKFLYLIAPSSSYTNSQAKIRQRIDLLTGLGFVVYVPKFSGDKLLLDPSINQNECEDSFLRDAVAPEAGAEQIISAIRGDAHGYVQGSKEQYCIMPLMGGDSFEKKLEPVLDHFSQNKGQKNLNSIICGYSNASCASFLAERGICQYVSTPFANIFTRSEAECEQQKNNLLEFLKNPQSFREEHREESFLAVAGQQNPQKIVTNHYIFNGGPFIDGIAGRKIDFNPKKPWSIAIEGFATKSRNRGEIMWKRNVERFFGICTKNGNLPEYFEVGIIASRMDGSNNSKKLQFDDECRIAKSDYNLAILRNQSARLIESMDEIIKKCKDDENSESAVLRAAGMGEVQKIIAEYDQNEKPQLSDESLKKIIDWQNNISDLVYEDIKAVCEENGVMMLKNPQLGHHLENNTNFSGVRLLEKSQDGCYEGRVGDRNKLSSDPSATPSHPKVPGKRKFGDFQQS
jgi:hypothetical protein